MTINAAIIADSTNISGSRLTTLELEYPRFIHGEFMTHRMFSRNAASSRAIPVAKMHEHISKTPAMPIYWGLNRPGMSAADELENVADAVDLWNRAKDSAIKYAEKLSKLGLHKQVTNRVTEPYQTMKVVVTATEFGNFFELRNHSDAQPEIQHLAKAMYDAMLNSKPEYISEGQWHVPYVTTIVVDDHMEYWLDESTQITKDQAIKVSASCCAQVSYRNMDTSLEKAEMIYDRLITSKPMHASPIEHQATPFTTSFTRIAPMWQLGVTHIDRLGHIWSGNFKGWNQYRQLLDQSTFLG